jgi:hypothetical protein
MHAITLKEAEKGKLTRGQHSDVCPPYVQDICQTVKAIFKALRSPQFVHDFTLGITPLLFGFNLLTSIGFLPHALQGRGDFRQIYAAAYMVRTGHSHELFNYEAQERFQNQVVSPQPYALPFIRPASQALLFAPLTWLPYRAAYFVFIWVNLLLLGLCFSLLKPWMRNLAVDSRWKPVTIFLSFTPLAYGITQGQDSILLLTLLAGALFSLRRQYLFAAGVLAGLGSFKFQLTIPIFLLFLCWRRWRFCGGFVLAALSLAGISIWVTGIEQAKIYARSLLALGTGTSNRPGLLRYTPGLHVGEMPNLHGLVHGIIGKPVASLIVFATLWVFILLWTSRSVLRKSPERQLLVAMTASIVLSYYTFMADLSVILPPLVATFDVCVSPAAIKRRSFLAGTSVLTLLSPACLWFFPLQFYLVSIPASLLLIAVVMTEPAIELDQPEGSGAQ